MGARLVLRGVRQLIAGGSASFPVRPGELPGLTGKAPLLAGNGAEAS